MLRYRIRRRIETEVAVAAIKIAEYTAENSGIPAATRDQGADVLASLKLDAMALSEEDCLMVLRLVGLNPSSNIVERGKHRMGLAMGATLTWDHLCHVWKDAIQAEKDSVAMLEKAFPFFDQDGSGFITREEMLQQFQELGGLLAKAEIEHFHDILDKDGNGVIDVRSIPLLAWPSTF